MPRSFAISWVRNNPGVSAAQSGAIDSNTSQQQFERMVIMVVRMRPLGILFIAVLLVPPAPGQTQSTRAVDFATDIHPVLESRCRSCHAGASAQGGLRVE